MFYAIYLVGILYYFVKATGGHYANFIDSTTAVYILLPCILVLFATRSFRAFGRSFLFAFGRKENSILRCKESMQSVWIVMFTTVISGVFCFLIGMINGCRLLAQEGLLADSAIWLLLDTTVAMLSLFYPMLICLVLLPVPFLLKKHLLVLQSDEKQPRSENT